MTDLVSVIIPCFNAAHTIDRAIRSIYIQDYPHIELIAVDDGSTDNSKEKILSWQEAFSAKGIELQYVFQANQGSGSAVNTGLKYVTGAFLSLLDADDEYLPGAISERVSYLQKNPQCDVVRSNGWIVRNEHRHLFVYEDEEKQCPDVFLALLRGETNNWAGSYMLRTEPLFSFYPDREIYTSRYGQNLQFLLPLAYKKACGFIDKPLMNYIQQPNSLTQTSDADTSKQKSLENAAGFRDIRIHMLRLIVSDSREQADYLRRIDGAYWRSILTIAVAFSDKSLIKKSYSNILQFEKATYQDKLYYYRTFCPLFFYLLRINHKIRRLLPL